MDVSGDNVVLLPSHQTQGSASASTKAAQGAEKAKAASKYPTNSFGLAYNWVSSPCHCYPLPRPLPSFLLPSILEPPDLVADAPPAPVPLNPEAATFRCAWSSFVAGIFRVAPGFGAATLAVPSANQAELSGEKCGKAE